MSSFASQDTTSLPRSEGVSIASYPGDAMELLRHFLLFNGTILDSVPTFTTSFSRPRLPCSGDAGLYNSRRSA